MTRTVTAGLDGSPESRAAAEWAASETRMLDLPLQSAHVREPVPEPVAQALLLAAVTYRHRHERALRESAQVLRLRHPGLFDQDLELDPDLDLEQ
ncbi:universal stress protein [Streptomyces resistomycificus]|nr:universal stress protein [Streptomyces resistomycificus]